MSEQPAPEPTMEEILASIRRIISEDDAPAAAQTADAETASVPAAHEPEPVAAPHDDVLELTQRVEAFAAEPSPEPPPPPLSPPSLGDIDFAEEPTAPAPTPAPEPTFTRAPEPEPAPAPRARPAPAPVAAAHEDEPLISGHAADTAADHFGQLAQSIVMPAAGRTLEDLVREMMRPMLKEWLDQHLSTIVEARVQAEVERISRARRNY